MIVREEIARTKESDYTGSEVIRVAVLMSYLMVMTDPVEVDAEGLTVTAKALVAGETARLVDLISSVPLGEMLAWASSPERSCGPLHFGRPGRTVSSSVLCLGDVLL